MIQTEQKLRNENEDWRDALAVKSSNCSCKGQEFRSQNPHQPSLITVLKYSKSSSDLYGHTNACAHTNTSTNTHTRIKFKKLKILTKKTMFQIKKETYE